MPLIPCLYAFNLAIIRHDCLTPNYLRVYLNGWRPYRPNVKGRKSQEMNAHAFAAALGQKQMKVEG